ncbi:glutamate synthase large subunit [Rubrobacter indicoceani]|uniref:glutamate synthase large subunit n=1 Tax=Rubrobacter indicoceani TaxID=2051957 RepID=UPI000E5C0873|nr:glutamate synthase large subunit [Rubrobacter indicoceani]
MTPRYGLYDPAYEHDACGFGFVARVDGRKTRATVEEGLEILRNLEHRGARGSDPETGDGAGIMVQIPDAFFRRVTGDLGFELPEDGRYAVGTLFEGDEECGLGAEAKLQEIAAEEGLEFLGFREVPVRPEHCGRLARDVMPRITQFFIGQGEEKLDYLDFERRLYVVRRLLHKAVGDDCYVVSLSSRTVIYKGLLVGFQVARFYPDLQEKDFTSAIALVHERFSTNTLGSWPLAHPYRYVAHNGEFNTIRGNVNWMRARENRLADDPDLGGLIKKVSPVIAPGQSDSASFDNALELIHLGGRSLPHAVAMMIPEAWENDERMSEERRAFYQYHSAMMEPWDGPAAVAFTDGRIIGATLDRNGLRPARYIITKDGRVIAASEEGALAVDEAEIVERWRLQPGRMLVVDTERHEVLHDEDVKRPLFERQPYAAWLRENEIHLDDLPAADVSDRPEPADLFERQKAFGYTMEDLRVIISPMATGGAEPTGSMGSDTPLAVLSEKPQMLFHYFKQHFAQVTNPPIDPIREELVMSLKMSLGPEQNFFDETPRHCRRVLLDHPILTDPEMEKVRQLGADPFHATTLSTLFSTARGDEGLERAVESLCDRAEKAVRGGSPVVVISDRGVNREQTAIPSLMATAAVHHHLVRRGIRTNTTLVVEAADAREVHHFALLVGYGATAINPYLAFETIEELARDGALGELSPEEASENYIKAVKKGLLKILSKMGISTLFSYCGAQIFEAVGIDQDVVDRYFTGTASKIGGVGTQEICRELLMRHSHAFSGVEDGPRELEVGGEYQLRQQGQYHQWNPASIVPLQRAVRTNDFETFQQFTKHFDEAGEFSTLRGLMDFKENAIPLEEVEPAREIVKRFTTGAMSLGSLSQEAHETLAVAMNKIGGKSNTGEGGEDRARFEDNRRSSIKQVASGRFGVTIEYLANSDVIQIKMAQGAKPGEGGQLPGHKISEYIAKIRYSTPGVGLISPPPHHDIYSIEDLAQLIHDLKNANPRARVSVKLVSEVGVGTVAAGVAKAKADHITIAGHDGGTGASPLSSIKHAGLPWELGLAETQQVLVQNDLRGRVIVETDGQLKTGRDVIVAALLGGEEFAFSTAPLVATGCIMMRVCHLNTCPVGIATQDPELRRRFTGTPEHVVNYFFFIAEEMRHYMAKMGFSTVREMVGRSDMLVQKDTSTHWKAKNLDLAPVFHRPDVGEEVSIHHATEQNHNLDKSLDNELIRLARPALERGERVEIKLPVKNINRTVGGMLAGEVARLHGQDGLPDGTLNVELEGIGGQSFGAWTARGTTITLKGTTNDYVGKGLSGGRLAVFPHEDIAYEEQRGIVVGNVALYGATDGEAYFRGFAGERFAVRNSGARTVVEGVGDHGCEYMTGGVVVVLGPTGRNFAAGMSGGVAFVLDVNGEFENLCNPEMVGLESVESDEDVEVLREMISSHAGWTKSAAARRILDDWEEYLPRFVKVMPNDLKRVLQEQEKAQMEVVG